MCAESCTLTWLRLHSYNAAFLELDIIGFLGLGKVKWLAVVQSNHIHFQRQLMYTMLNYIYFITSVSGCIKCIKQTNNDVLLWISLQGSI